MTSPLSAQSLWFQTGKAILRCPISGGRSDTAWVAPYPVFDISVSRDGSLLCFTRNTPGSTDGAARQVGFVVLGVGKPMIIPSEAAHNCAAVISPDHRTIAFNALRSSSWHTALYAPATGTFSYDIDSNWVYAWQADSVLLLTAMDGIVRHDLRTGTVTAYTLPDPEAMSGSVPGTQAVLLSDSVQAFLCTDDQGDAGLDGPPSNLFLVHEKEVTRVFKGKIDVRSVYPLQNALVVQYDDYTHAKSGRAMVVQLDPATGQRKTLPSHGTLVGVTGK